MAGRRAVLAAMAAAGMAVAGTLTFLALRDDGPTPPPRAGAAGPGRVHPVRREVMDIVDAVARGRMAAALAGLAALLPRLDSADLDADLREAFMEARLSAGGWGLSEAGDLAASGEATGAEETLRRAEVALRGTGKEEEAAEARTRIEEILARLRAVEEERRRREIMGPAEAAVAAARDGAAGGRTEKALADLRAVLKVATDPDAKKILQAEEAALRTRLAGDRSRAGRRRRADEALSRGDYGKAREILRELASDAGEEGGSPEEAARDAEKLEALQGLEENREPDALKAVRMALRWVVKQQLPDGSFSQARVDAEGRKATDDELKKGPNRPGITGLVALALLGHVRHDLTDEFEPALDRTLAALLAMQREDGSFSVGGLRVYESAICTLALVDADRLLRKRGVREAAARGLRWLEEARNSDGGWRYRPAAPPSDVSATCWALQALLHARMGKYEVKSDVVELAFAYIERMEEPTTGRVGYLNPGAGSMAMTAAALFCRLRNGMGPADEAVQRAADLIVKNPPKAGWGGNSYQLFYASDAMSRIGGKWWKAWAPALKKHLLDGQLKKGDAEGAWPTAGDPWASRKDAGAVYLAAMNALSLENFFEHRE